MRKIELNENQKTFIGIDVSKDTLEVFVDTCFVAKGPERPSAAAIAHERTQCGRISVK